MPEGFNRQTIYPEHQGEPVTIVFAALDVFGAECLAFFDELRGKAWPKATLDCFWFGPPQERPSAQPPFWKPATVRWRTENPFCDFPKVEDEAPPDAAPLVAQATKSLHALHDLYRASDEVWSGSMLLILVGSGLERATMQRLTATFQAYLDAKNRNLWGAFRISAFLSLFPQSNLALASADVSCACAYAGIGLASIQAALEESHRVFPEYRVLTPVYLAADTDSLEERELPRADAVSVVATALFGKVRSVLSRPLSPGIHSADYTADHRAASWLFHISGEQDGVSGVDFTGRKPYAVVGSNLLVCRRTLWRGALAAAFCAETLRAYGHQAAPEPQWGPNPRDAAEPRLPDLAKSVMERAWQQINASLAEAGFPDCEGEPFTIEWFEKALGWDRLLEQWRKKVEPSFGWKRIAGQALEDYEHCLNELRQLMQAHFCADRARRSAAFASAAVEAVDRAIAHALDGACEDSWSTVSDLQPHLLARQSVKLIDARLQKIEDEARATLAQSGLDEPTRGEFQAAPAWIEKLYQKLLDTVASVPSRLALFARAGLIIASFLAIGFVAHSVGWLSLRGLNLAPLHELVAVATVSLLAGAVFWCLCRINLMRMAKRIRERFNKWYQHVLEDFYRVECDRETRSWASATLSAVAAYRRWLAQPGTVLGERSGFADWLRQQYTGDPSIAAVYAVCACTLHARERRSFLHFYPQHLARGAARFDALMSRLCDLLKSSRHLVHLPRWNREDEGVVRVKRELIAILPGLNGSPNEMRAQIRSVLQGVAHSISGRQEAALPWCVRAGSPPDDDHIWRGAHEAVTEPDEQLSLPSLPWFSTIRDRWLGDEMSVGEPPTAMLEEAAREDQRLYPDARVHAEPKLAGAHTVPVWFETWVPLSDEPARSLRGQRPEQERVLGEDGFHAIVAAAGGCDASGIIARGTSAGSAPHTPIALDVHAQGLSGKMPVLQPAPPTETDDEIPDASHSP